MLKLQATQPPLPSYRVKITCRNVLNWMYSQFLVHPRTYQSLKEMIEKKPMKALKEIVNILVDYMTKNKEN